MDETEKQRVVVGQFRGATTMDALPLAAGVLVSAARATPGLDAAYRFDIVVERRAPEAVINALDAAPPTILALSCYTWNFCYSLQIARLARARWPRIRLILGGPDIPRRDAAARAFLHAHPCVDVIVFGEGELTFVELLAA